MILEQRIRLDRIGRMKEKWRYTIILDGSLDHHISHILQEKERLTNNSEDMESH